MTSIALLKARHSLHRHMPVQQWLTRHPDRAYLAKVAWAQAASASDAREQQARLRTAWEAQRCSS